MSKTTYIDELKLIASNSGFSGAKAAVLGVAGAVTGIGAVAGNSWAAATKTIVEGTGATGPALDQLQDDFRAVARYGPNAADAIADINTHLGLTGPELQTVASAMLKAGVNTNNFSSVAKQLNLDARWDGPAARPADGRVAGDRCQRRPADRPGREEQCSVPSCRRIRRGLDGHRR